MCRSHIVTSMYWSEPIVQARLTNGRNVRLAYPHVLCLCLALGGEDSSIGFLRGTFLFSNAKLKRIRSVPMYHGTELSDSCV